MVWWLSCRDGVPDHQADGRRRRGFTQGHLRPCACWRTRPGLHDVRGVWGGRDARGLLRRGPEQRHIYGDYYTLLRGWDCAWNYVDSCTASQVETALPT